MMLANRRNLYTIIGLILSACLVMAWVDGVLSPSYWVKSSIKIVLFLLLPITYAVIRNHSFIRDLFIPKKKEFIQAILLGLGVYIFIIGAYFLLGPFFDFSKVTVALEDNIGVNKENFLFVAIYISFVNSLLEEFFFRGFAFLSLKKITTRKFAYIFSAAAFSFYHVAIMTSWFSPLLFVLLIVSLFLAGMMFNWLNEKSGTIYSSWMVHMFANFAINTIGFSLFGII